MLLYVLYIFIVIFNVKVRLIFVKFQCLQETHVRFSGFCFSLYFPVRVRPPAPPLSSDNLSCSGTTKHITPVCGPTCETDLHV